MSFKSEIKDGQITIYLPAQLGPEIEKDWNASCTQWLLEPVTTYTLDFKDVLVIKPPVYRLLILFSQSIAKNEKKLVSRGLSDSLLTQLRADGVAKSLNPAAAQAPKPPVDFVVLNHFITATQKTIEVQAATPCTPGKPYVMKAEEVRRNSNIAVAGVLAINSDKFKGSITLCFPREVFMQIYSSMVGEPCTDITPETMDGASELLNIIYGTAKTELNKQGGYDLKPTLPTVIAGEKLNIHSNSRTPVLVIPFTVKDGEFLIEIALEST